MPIPLKDFDEVEDNSPLTRRHYLNDVPVINLVDPVIYPDRFTLERKHGVTTSRGYLGMQLVYILIHSQEADHTAEGTWTKTYQLTSGKTVTIKEFYPGDVL